MGDVVDFTGVIGVGRENAKVIKMLVYEHSAKAFGWTTLEANIIRAIAALSDDYGEWRTLSTREIAKESMCPSGDMINKAISKAAKAGVIELTDRQRGSAYFKVRFRRSELFKKVGES